MYITWCTGTIGIPCSTSFYIKYHLHCILYILSLMDEWILLKFLMVKSFFIPTSSRFCHIGAGMSRVVSRRNLLSWASVTDKDEEQVPSSVSHEKRGGCKEIVGILIWQQPISIGINRKRRGINIITLSSFFFILCRRLHNKHHQLRSLE